MTSTVPAPVTRTAEGSALQAVLLDMDGTLVDTEGFWWDVEVEVFARARPPPRRLLARCRGRRPDDPQRRLPDRGHRRRHHARRAHRPAQRAASRTRIGRAVPLMPGAARLLAELAAHEVPTALVSASHRRIIDRVLDSLGPEHFAPDASPATRSPAPSRTPTRTCSPPRGLGADPARCAVIEDTATGRRLGRGRGLPGRRRALRRADRARGRTHRRRLARRSRPAISARPDHCR